MTNPRDALRRYAALWLAADTLEQRIDELTSEHNDLINAMTEAEPPLVALLEAHHDKVVRVDFNRPGSLGKAQCAIYLDGDGNLLINELIEVSSLRAQEDPSIPIAAHAAVDCTANGEAHS